LNFGWAMTFGAPARAATPVVANTPAFTMNLRRSVITLPP
jgi:hypothetical protein